MAGSWLPQTGEEWMRWSERELRILRRTPPTKFRGEWPGAIDGSSGIETEPEEEYVDDTPGDYVEPEEFTDVFTETEYPPDGDTLEVP